MSGALFAPIASDSPSEALQHDQSNMSETKKEKKSKRPAAPDASKQSAKSDNADVNLFTQEKKHAAVSKPTLKSHVGNLDDFEKDVSALREILQRPISKGLPKKSFAYTKDVSTKYHDFRCDVLVAEAGALVGRCFSIQREWDVVSETAYNFSADIERFSKSDEIFKLEEKHGYYDVDPSLSQGDLKSLLALEYHLKTASETIEKLFWHIADTSEDQRSWTQLLGWLSHISAYGNSGNATASVTWDGISDTVINFCHKAATSQGDMQLSTLLRQLSSDMHTRKGQAASVSEKAPGFSAKALWDEKNKVFRKLHVEVLRNIYAERKRLASEPGGNLDYVSRLSTLQKQFDLIMSDALSRFQAISRGFSTLFGITEEIPTEIASLLGPRNTTASPATLLNLSEEWLNKLGLRHARFVQSEQIYPLCISVKESVSETSWETFLREGYLRFHVADGLFQEQYHVRLRSVSISSIGLTGVLSVSLRVPAESFYVHRDFSKHAVSQANVQPVKYSRVASVELRAAERMGTNIVYNCSPIGTWDLSVAERTSSGHGFQDLKDIFIELLVAAQ